MLTFYYPRWLFPNNLGDSIMTTFIPKLLKRLSNKLLEVVTDEELGELFKKDKNVDRVRLPFINEILNHSQWQSIAFNKKAFAVYPEWRPNFWDTWNSNFDYFFNHPSINLITLNYCMQLGLPIDLDPELYYPEIYCEKKEKINAIGIVPDSKLAGRPTPHPGCDGIGFRFNGPKGLVSWKSLVDHIRKNSDVKIYEFSKEFLHLGDYHVPRLNLLKLGSLVSSLKLGIMSDGGIHHVFNSQRTKVILLGAQKVNKPYFFKLLNGIFDEKIHEDCLLRCKDQIRSLSGWSDLWKSCDLSCEKVDPIKIAELALKEFQKNDY